MKNSNPEILHVIDSFQISNLGNIVFIKYDNEILGLKNGTVLKSTHSNKSWFVKNRIIEFPSIETAFENETIINSFLHFPNIEKRNAAQKKAKELNDKNIFQYQVEPIFHDKKPEKNEILEIIKYEESINFEILRVLLRELKFHSENGESQILSMGFITFEVSKMTNTKTTEVYNHLKFLTTEGYVEKISNEPLIYNLTEKGKFSQFKTDIK